MGSLWDWLGLGKLWSFLDGSKVPVERVNGGDNDQARGDKMTTLQELKRLERRLEELLVLAGGDPTETPACQANADSNMGVTSRSVTLPLRHFVACLAI